MDVHNFQSNSVSKSHPIYPNDATTINPRNSRDKIKLCKISNPKVKPPSNPSNYPNYPNTIDKYIETCYVLFTIEIKHM